jgi:penicillin-insensitive murein endopeptidase
MPLVMPSLAALARNLTAAVLCAAALVSARPAMAGDPLAKLAFGAEKLPAAGPAESIGFYSKGCFEGGVGLPLEGSDWEVMRPSRNRRWGHPTLIKVLERLARDGKKVGWNGLLVGDISQPRGGPMLTGHASHQIGLDADIWFTPMPKGGLTLNQRETMSAVSVLKPHSLYVDDRRWTPAYEGILKMAASEPGVERVLVHPGVKKKLCDTVRGDRSWLSKIRPFWGHDDHFHVRIGCQPGSPDCKRQAATPNDDGCGKPLAWWFTEEPWRPNKNPDAPKARDLMTMASLPKQCLAVLDAPSPVSAEAVTYHGVGGAPALAAAPTTTVRAAIIDSETVPFSASAFAPTPKIDVPLPLPRPGN